MPCPSGKVSFSTGSRAKRMIKKLKGINTQTKGRLHPYQCPLCGSWHLTSKVRWSKDKGGELS